MILDLRESPIYDSNSTISRLDALAQISAQGARSYLLGHDRCPPFRDPAMSEAWLIGWRIPRAYARRKARRQQKDS
jgi:ribosome modulation factor